MSTFDPEMSGEFREYAALQLRRHRLLVGGEKNQSEAAAIASQLDVLWDDLDDVQQASLNGMNSDLSWVRRGCTLAPKGKKKEEVTEEDRGRLTAALSLNEWHEALHFLRVCTAILPVRYIASQRGTAYEAIDLPDYSTVFYEQAVGFTPSNGSLGSLRNDPARMLKRAKAIVDAPNDFSSDAVALSVAIVLKGATQPDRIAERARFSGILDKVLERAQAEPTSRTAIGQTYQFAATGFELLNERDKARQAFEEGLDADPNNEALLVGKGLLLYGSEPEQVDAVLNKAADLGTLRAVPSVLLPPQPLLRVAEPIQNTIATDLVMELTNEQGGNRKSQVQPPKAVWQHYFGIIEEDLPQSLDLMNMTVDPPQEEPARTVSLKHHVMTIELAGADRTRPALVRFRRTGPNKYSYWVYGPDTHPTEYGHYAWLLDNTPNPLRSKGRYWIVI